ncbi:MAG: HupE/UreJ family protein [Candidatus Acidiferrum sp.]
MIRPSGVARKTVVGSASLLLLPVASLAHLSSTGLGPFYDGLTHFWRSPEEFIPALALAFLAGLRGPRAGRYTLFILPGAWFVGGLAGFALPKADHSTPVVCFSFLMLGALVAVDAQLRPVFVAGIASAFGLVFGYFDGVGMSFGSLGILGLLGSVSSLFVLVALAAALVASLQFPWMRIVVRVAGSWIVAAGLLLIGWAFHTNNHDPRAQSSAIQQQSIQFASSEEQTP